MPKKLKLFHFLIVYICFQEINSKNNYISLEFLMVDDCIREISISGQKIFEFKPNTLDDCDFKYQNIYPKFFTKNYRYDFDIEIKFTFQDSVHYDGFMNITVYFNEYIIKVSDQKFWKCTDCGNFGLGGDRNWDYDYYDNRINYYCGHGNSDGKCKSDGAKFEVLYHFIFKIESLDDLRNGNKDSQQFEVNNNYYALNRQRIYYRQIYYLDNELELINFNTTENFFIAENTTLPIEYTDYYFKMIYMDNNFHGNLKGLDTNNNNNIINNGGSFKVSDSTGLKYELTPQEKINREVNVSLKITAYNCPNCADFQSKPVSPETEFIFIITVYGWPETTHPNIPTTSPNIPKTTQPNLPETTQPKIPEITQPNIPETTQPKIPETTLPNIPETAQPYIPIITQPILPGTSKINLHCLDNYYIYDPIKDINIHLCPDYILAAVKENILDMLNRIDYNKTYKILAKDYVAQIRPIDYSNNSRINTEIFSPSSYVNFSECEKKLRHYYPDLSNKKITFIQIELNNTNDIVMVNQLEYQAYDDKYNELNLSLCEKDNITVLYSVKPEKEDEINLISYFKDKGIDILDINDNFFNDVCLPYDDSKKDLTLKNRIEEIYKNYTFCEKNCVKDKIIFEEMAVLCNCSIKKNIDAEKFNFDFYEDKVVAENQDFKIAKCSKALSSLKDNLNNAGFWIFSILMIINIILVILFNFSLKPIQEDVSKEMIKNGYFKPVDDGHLFCHNYIKKLDKLIIRLNEMKKDYIGKKQGVPPKKKTHIINLSDKSDRKNILNKNVRKTQKVKTSKEVSKDIELLKSRMEKTKRPKTFKIFNKNSTKGEFFEEKKMRKIYLKNKRLIMK